MATDEERALGRARVGLILIAVLLRVAYVQDGQRLPFVAAPLFDSAVYQRQAQAILAGDFGHATLLAFGPLTGWFLAATGDFAVPLQLAMGVVTAILIERLARHLADPRAGFVALALYVVYGLPLFYETKWMSETLGLFLLTASLVVDSSQFHSTTAREATPAHARAVILPHFVAGALLGLATLARASLLLVLPFSMLALLLVRRVSGEGVCSRSLRVGGAALGLALVLGANGGWNLRHTGHFVPVILVSETAARASTFEWNGSLARFGRDGQPPSAWDVVRQAEVTLGRRSPDPPIASSSRASPSVVGGLDLLGLVRGAPSKLLALFHDIETSFDYGYYGERLEIRSLGWLPGSMGTYLLLALVGAVVLVRRGEVRRLVALAPVPLGVALTFVVFHPSSRYRLPVTPVVLALAGVGVAALWDAVQRTHGPRRLRVLALAGVVGLVSVVFAYRQIGYELADPSSWDLRIAEGDLARGDLGGAKRRLTRAWRTSSDGSSTRRHILAVERSTGLRVPR